MKLLRGYLDADLQIDRYMKPLSGIPLCRLSADKYM